ncbi:hypothetical protein ACHAW6_000459 [Cyclotella cf. meneghiniana]
MMAKLHTGLSVTLVSTINCIVYFKSAQLIAFIHGPSSQVEAVQQWDALQSLKPISQNDDKSWINDITCNAYNQSYQQSSSLFRDAGVIASIFTIIAVLFPGFISRNLSKMQRLHFVFVIPSLWITPGLFGQILSKTIPVELYFLSRGIVGLLNMVYCSLNAVVSGPVKLSLMNLLVYELEVVWVAAMLLFFLLGIVPLGEERGKK